MGLREGLDTPPHAVVHGRAKKTIGNAFAGTRQIQASVPRTESDSTDITRVSAGDTESNWETALLLAATTRCDLQLFAASSSSVCRPSFMASLPPFLFVPASFFNPCRHGKAFRPVGAICPDR
ncbi:hypothetical protein Bpro_1893 [Polaromonas sp. JS666]|nr:hypothetical protein Bpro_1893 [Polaromonas sp. JS666]